MSEEEEIKTEINWLGDEVEVIYKDGVKVGETKTNNTWLAGEEKETNYYDGRETTYTTTEERGGIAGILADEVDVTRDPYGNEISTTKTEERGGFAGILADEVDVTRDPYGNEISTTKTDKRLFGEVKIKEYASTKEYLSDKNANNSLSNKDNSSGGASFYSAATSKVFGVFRSIGAGILILFLILVGISLFGQVLMVVGSYFSGLPHHTDSFFTQILLIPVSILSGLFLWAPGYLLSLPLYYFEHVTGLCIAFGPGVVWSDTSPARIISSC